jgi:hypothetical protein
MSETTATLHSTQALASFLAGLRFEDLPPVLHNQLSLALLGLQGVSYLLYRI